MSRRITYILGAGASYNALPIVNEMNDWMDDFLLNWKYKNLYIESKEFNYWDSLISKIKQHSTIDTYAKKLSLQNDKEEMSNLKSLISSFLYYSQTSGQGYSHILKDNSNHEDILKLRKENSLDYRYDSLLASLLVSENRIIKVPDNINFISWNYDIQLELSYLNYTKNSIIDSILELQTIDDFTYKNIFSNGEKIDLNKSKHIKLNGIALPIHNNKLDDLSYGNFEDKESIKSIVSGLLKTRRSNYHSTLSFAWEKKDIQNDEILKLAQNVVAESHDIIIIGYSFPFFNREIDRILFKNINSSTTMDGRVLKRVYLQSHPQNIDRLNNDLIGIFPHIRNGSTRIITESDLSQFVIPYDYQPL